MAFISNYKKKGLSVEIERFNYAYSGDSLNVCTRYISDSYRICIGNVSVDKVRNLDTMREMSKKIAAHFYDFIIEDSILFYSNEINVKISEKIDEKTSNYNNSNELGIQKQPKCYMAKFRKEELQDFCGFKIIEKGNLLIRQKLTKNSSELKMISEEYP